jgi:predicted TIM-barrel fold metal-dependent hydrolase
MSIEPGAAVEACFSDDRRLYPIYERCQALGLPISVTLSGYLSAMAGHDLRYGSPSSVYRVATDFRASASSFPTRRGRTSCRCWRSRS